MTHIATTVDFTTVGDGPAAAKVARLPMVMHARVVTGAGGGPDKTIINSPRFLGQHGYGCVCAFLRPPADPGFEVIRQRARDASAAIVEIDDRGPWSPSIVARLHRICEAHNVDVWHAHDYKTNLLGLLLRRRRPMRLITTCHGWVERTWKTTIYHQVDRLTLGRYDRVIAVSADIHDRCLKLGVPAERLKLIENAIDTERYARRQPVATAKRAMDWPEERFLIGAVGRLADEKGFDLLLRAVAKLAAEGRDVGLAIAGDGAGQAALERLVGELGMSDRARLLGFQSELIPFYEAMDAYALSSRREGLPNVLLEAMAMAVPVVSTRVAGVPMLIDDGKSGLLTDIGCVDQLAAALARMMDDAELRKRLADAGRATIVNRYSFTARMAKVAALYDELLNSAPSARDGTP